MSAFKHIGKSLPHDSAALHVSGRATYIDDMPEISGTLHVAPGFAKNGAKGAITKLDLSKVKAAPGVVAVLTAQDITGKNDCSPVMGDDPILAKDEIHFHGQVIFAVVAISHEAARAAAQLAEIEIAKQVPIVTIEQAAAVANKLLPDYAFSNMVEPAKGLSHSFYMGGQDHFYLESQIAYAVPQEKSGMHIYSSTQHPTEVQHCVAAMLGIDDANVTCECRRMGGGFGGKESQAAQWAALASLAAYKTGKPAKCRLDRDDDMVMTGKRHEFNVKSTVDFDANHKITSATFDMAARCGYSADLSGAICDRAMFHADNAYYYPSYHISTQRLKTDTVSNTAFRGFGGPQGILAAEAMMENAAVSLGVDALNLRKANLYDEKHNTTPYGQEVKEHVLADIIAQLEASSDYEKRRTEIAAFNQNSRILKKGLALVPVKFGISFTNTMMNQAGALVHVYADGSVQVNHGGTEMGQGLYQKVAQIVAEVFDIEMAQVHITATRTDKVPNTSPTAASSGADLNGMAAKLAAEEIKARMDKVDAGRNLSFKDLAKACIAARVSLSSTGYYATPEIHWDRAKGKGNPFFYFANGAACSEVVIDTLTGEMKLTRVDILHDVGKSLNPALDIGQIEGGFVQGMGWLTTEELVFDNEGRLRTHAPSTYKIPTASDVPEDFRVSLYESSGNKADTIYRSKAVGEPPLMHGVSVWCAIYNAIASTRNGIAPKLNAPATPEAILKALRA